MNSKCSLSLTFQSIQCIAHETYLAPYSNTMLVGITCTNDEVSRRYCAASTSTNDTIPVHVRVTVQQ